MPDIFLSYANEDREAAQALINLLEAAGWTVWSDRMIVGATFTLLANEL